MSTMTSTTDDVSDEACTCYACGHPTTAGNEDWKFLFRPLEGHTITLCERHGADVKEHRLVRTVFGNTRYLRMFLKPNLHHKPLKFDVTQICRDHQRGSCTRGIMCRFLHICRKLPLQAPTPSYGTATATENHHHISHHKAANASYQSHHHPEYSSPSTWVSSERSSTPLSPASSSAFSTSPASPPSLEHLAAAIAAAQVGSLAHSAFPLMQASGLGVTTPANNCQNTPHAPCIYPTQQQTARHAPLQQQTLSSLLNPTSSSSATNFLPYGKQHREHPNQFSSNVGVFPSSSRPPLRSVSNAAPLFASSPAPAAVSLHPAQAQQSPYSFFLSSSNGSNVSIPSGVLGHSAVVDSGSLVSVPEKIDAEAAMQAQADLLRFAGNFYSSPK